MVSLKCTFLPLYFTILKVVDYKLFTPGEELLKPGLFWVLEQVRGKRGETVCGQLIWNGGQYLSKNKTGSPFEAESYT